MQRFRQYTPFTVLEFEADVWEYAPHKHNYYEIIFILKGKGDHTINGQTFPYTDRDIFLLSPEDHHYFEIGERTAFSFFKFTELIFKKDTSDAAQRFWLERIEAIITIPNQLPGAVKFSGRDKEYAFLLYELIRHESQNKGRYTDEIVADGMSILISIIARNICYNYQTAGIEHINDQGESDLINKMLTYIRHNVYSPKLVSAEMIAQHLGLSKNYVGIFFKKHTGETLQSYLVNYKLFLAENRIVNSSTTISNIALDLGYNDLSHFNKHFKRKYGMMPGRYRKERSRQHVDLMEMDSEPGLIQ